MTALTSAIQDLKQEERFVGYAYDDATGQPIVPGYTMTGHATLWWGLCVEKGRIPNIHQAVPDECLQQTVEQMAYELEARWQPYATQPLDVQRALIQLSYQIGVTGVLGFQKMLVALNLGNREEAARQALDSTLHKQTPARTERLAALLRGA